MRKKLLILLLVLLLAFIWGQSLLSVETSSAESMSVLDILRPALVFIFGKAAVTHNFVRKLAHFAEFFLLGATLFSLLPRGKWRLPLSAGLCLLAALLDETIQIFSGRGDQISDVWLDFSGAASGILLFFLLRLLWLLSKNRKEQ